MSSLKETNKQFIFNLGDTTDVMFSLIDFLDFNPINNHYKSHVQIGLYKILPLNSRQDPTFDSFYAPRKKRRLFNQWNSIMCGQYSFRTFNIEHYINFFFLTFSFKIFGFLFFYFSFKNFVVFSWNFVIFNCYVLLI
jgi:hypothetical protein